jgi:ribosomal protein S12 methylthiotransferase
VGVFEFSREEGTHSHDLPDQVTKKVMKARRNKLMALQQGISQNIHDTFVGTEMDMLVEAIEAKSGILIGRTFRDAPDVDGTFFARTEDPTIEPGDLVRVKVTVAKPYDLHGEVVAPVLA